MDAIGDEQPENVGLSLVLTASITNVKPAMEGLVEAGLRIR